MSFSNFFVLLVKDIYIENDKVYEFITGKRQENGKPKFILPSLSHTTNN